MNREEKKKIEKYLEENMHVKRDILEELRDLSKNSNLRDILTDIGSSFLSSVLPGALPPAAGNIWKKSQKRDSGENGQKETMKEWMDGQRKGKSSFPRVLKKYIKEKGYEGAYSRLYNKILMDRRLFSKLINEEEPRHPSDRTVFKLAIGLELTAAEAQELLSSTGYIFNSYQKTHLIIKYCIENSVYEIDKVDEYLIMFGEKPLFSSE